MTLYLIVFKLIYNKNIYLLIVIYLTVTTKILCCHGLVLSCPNPMHLHYMQFFEQLGNLFGFLRNSPSSASAMQSMYIYWLTIYHTPQWDHGDCLGQKCVKKNHLCQFFHICIVQDQQVPRSIILADPYILLYVEVCFSNSPFLGK